MSQKDVEFLIEQIVADTEAGYLVERSRWKKEADERDFAQNADGNFVALTKNNMVSTGSLDDALMKQNGDRADNERTSMWKSSVSRGLRRCLDEKQFAPAEVAKMIRIELENTAESATIKPQSVVEICKQYIRSILAIAGEGKNSYKGFGPSFKPVHRTQPDLTPHRAGANKKDILLLAKTIKSPEFMKELKKEVGRRLSSPSSWFKSVEKPNTKGRFSDV
jgi:hypothetical protein